MYMQGAWLALCLDMSQSHDSHVMSLKRAFRPHTADNGVLVAKTKISYLVYDGIRITALLPSLNAPN